MNSRTENTEGYAFLEGANFLRSPWRQHRLATAEFGVSTGSHLAQLSNFHSRVAKTMPKKKENKIDQKDKDNKTQIRGISAANYSGSDDKDKNLYLIQIRYLNEKLDR